MNKIRFSTGSTSFDKYLGGIIPGDTLLLFVSNHSDPISIIDSINQFADRSAIHVQYFSFAKSAGDRVQQNKNHKLIPFTIEEIKQKSFPAKFKKYIASIKNSSIVILDDLSILADNGVSQKNIQVLYNHFKEICKKKEAFGITSVIRDRINVKFLAELKDIPNICIDLLQFKDDIFCQPLALKGRYVKSDIIPFKFTYASGIHRTQRMNESSTDSILGKYELRFEESFNKSSEALVIIDENGTKREFNDRAVALLGYSVEELKVLRITDVISNEYRINFLRAIAELQKKNSVTISLDISKKNGKTVPVDMLISHIGDSRYFIVVHDEKENRDKLKLLEHQKFEYERIILLAGTAIILVQENKIVFCNDAFNKIIGFEYTGEIKDKNIKSFITNDSFRRLQRYLQSLKDSGDTGNIELQFLGKEGAISDARVSIQQVTYRYKNCYQFSIQDTTTEKKIISETTEKLNKYQYLIEGSTVPIAIIREGILKYANASFFRIFNIEPSKIIGKEILSIISEEDKERFTEYLTKHLSGKNKLAQFQIKLRNKDDKIGEYYVYLDTIKNSKPVEVTAYFDDRSKEIAFEKELTQRRNEIEFLKNIGPTLFNTFDAAKTLHTAIIKISELTSLESGAVYLTDDANKNMTLADSRNMPGEITKKINELELEHGIGGFVSKTLLPQIFKGDRYPSYLPHRGLFLSAGFKLICLIPLISSEKLIGMFLFASRKEEAYTRFTADLYSTLGNLLGTHINHAKSFNTIKTAGDLAIALIESSPDILYQSSPSGKFNLINEKIEGLTGYTRREFIRVKDLWLKLIHPDDKKYLLERVTRLESIQGRDEIEYRVLPKGKAEYRIINDGIELIRDTNGSVVQILGTIRDVTESRTSMKLLTSENLFQKNILESVPESVIVLDDFQRCIYCNKPFEELFHTKFEEINKEDARSIFRFYHDMGFHEIIERIQTWNLSETIEIPWRETEESNERFVRATFRTLVDSEAQKIGTVITFIDVTEQKRSENEIRESQYILSNVIDTMGDILILTNLQGTVVQVNRTFLNVLGYSRTETNGCEFPYPWLIDEEMGRFVLWIASLREQNWLHDFDMTLRAKDGTLIPVSLSTTLLRNRLGEPIAMLNIARNITDRKKLMSALENRNKQIELFNRIITKANQTFDLRDIFITVSHEIKNIVSCDEIRIGILSEDRESLDIYSDSRAGGLGERKNLAVSQTLSQYVIRDQKSLIIDDLQNDERYKNISNLTEGIRSQIGIPITLKDKIYGTLELAGTEPFIFTEDHLTMLVPIAQQIGSIIDRAILFRQVTDDSSYIHNLLDSINSIVYTVDTELRIREVNNAWYQFMKEFGRAGIEDYEGKYLYDLLPNDAVKFTLQGVVEQMLSGVLNIFSQEILYATSGGDRIYQLTVNSMVIGSRITGLVFTQTDITPLKKTEAELKKSNEQLIALNEISNIISNSFEFRRMLQSALPLFKNLINAYAVIIYLQENEANDLVMASQSGFNDEEYKTIVRFKQSGFASGSNFNLKDPVYISENASLAEKIIPENRNILQRLKLNALAIIPIISNDQVNGVLNIFFKHDHHFTEQEQQILTLVSNQFGSAVQNAKLYAELRSQVERLTVLYEISQQLTSTLSIDEIFDTVYKHVKQVIPFQMFKVDLYEERSKTKTPVLHVEKISGDEIFITTPAQPSTITYGTTQELVIKSRKPYHSTDRRTILIPMLSKDVLFGIMSVEADIDVAYSETQIKLMESIANLTALALEKAMLYEETVQKSSEIQRRNKELDDFTYVVSHDLKEPLISIEGFSRILQVDYQDLIQEEGKDYLDSIVGATTRMKGLIDDLLLLSRVSRPAESFREISIGDVIRDIRIDMEFTIKLKNVIFSIPEELPVVFGNDTQVRIVFRNLIGNAVKFNDKKDPLVEVKFQNAENNYYLFSIRDNGIGIDQEFYDKIFVIFQRLHRREEYEGTGAGLAIVKKIVELHKGRIWVESEIGSGSTFYFTLPRKSLTETQV
jgi:PAS domain S-box-containing protein